MKKIGKFSKKTEFRFYITQKYIVIFLNFKNECKTNFNSYEHVKIKRIIKSSDKFSPSAFYSVPSASEENNKKESVLKKSSV